MREIRGCNLAFAGFDRRMMTTLDEAVTSPAASPVFSSPRGSTSIDDWLQAKKKSASRRRLLDDLTSKLETTVSVEILNSNDDSVMEHVSSCLIQKQPSGDPTYYPSSNIPTSVSSKTSKLQKLYLLNGLSLQGAAALRQALPFNTSLKMLKIFHNEDEKALLTLFQCPAKNAAPGTTTVTPAIADSGGLATNKHITDLVLSNCPLRSQETVSALVKTITSTANILVRISLVDIPSLGMQDAGLLAPLLQNNAHNTNASIKGVKLIRCGIDARGATALAKALAAPSKRKQEEDTARQHSSLRYLSLEGNPIGNEGAMALANALHSNQTLTHLMLCRNCFIGNQGVLALSEMLLDKNTTLQELDLSGNPEILILGKEALVRALQQNPTLLEVGMRVTRRHPLRPTVVEQLTDLLHVNAVRHQWNQQQSSVRSRNHRRMAQALPPTRSRITRKPCLGNATATAPVTSSMGDQKSQNNQQHCLSSNILPHYLAKVAGKPSVLYLSLQENADMILPYL